MAGGWLTGPWLDWGAAALVAAAAGLVACAATARVVGWLTRRAILDRPNERSSHAAPVPRGGGLGVLAGLLPAWALVSAAAGGPAWRWAALAGAAVLASVSWRDDRGHVPAGIRLLAQAAAVLPAAALLPGPVLQGLAPPWLDLAFAVVAWVWFVNLYNFMDGIDGITGVETAAIGTGIALMAALSGTADEGALGLVL
ncbi:MAG: glycosyl transferase, partial [Alphaproteobacteria bacterium]